MPDEGHSARPAWFHVMLYALGGFLAAGGLVCMALQFAIPNVHGLSGTGAAFAVIGAVIVASVAGQRKMDRIRRDLVAHHVVAEEVKQLTLVHLETFSQAIRAEQRDMYDKGMAEARMAGLFEITERLEGFRADIEKRLAEFAVDVFRTQESGAVVPLQRPQARQ